MQFGKLMVILMVSFAAGCGSGSPTIDASPMSSAREMLEEVANTGVIGGQFQAIEAELDKMKQTDGAKATSLIKQFNQLKAMKDVAKIKATAGNIAGQL
ncbi:MAG: hypothetical protein IT423_15125 [Pirellulaceae bacterium]|nr:hypothetical protein [Pirellulaceae bacterium]